MRLPTCREVSGSVARGEFATAPLAARLRMIVHLAICRHCRKFKRQIGLIQRAVRQGAQGVLDSAKVATLQTSIRAKLGSLPPPAA